MAKPLYGKKDGVIILSDNNFTGAKLTSGFKGPGVLKAYAAYCPFCQNKVRDIKKLAKAFKTENIGLVLYVIEADKNHLFSSATEIEAYPTMMYVDNDGNVGRLVDQFNQPASDVPSIIDSLCTTKMKCLKKKK
jgi:hypothetical protein